MIERHTLRRACLAVLLAAVAGAVGCGRGGDETGEASGETIAVTVQAARLGSLRDVVSVAGTVVPSVVADFVVTANQPSEIVELPKNEGDAVAAGDVLVRLDVPSVANEIATRQLELGEATTRLEAAPADASRLERLVKDGLAARNKLEVARAARTTAETNVTQIKARFDAAKAMETGGVIRARFAGTVIKRWHAPGDLVAGGESDPILRVIDPTRLQVALQVPRAQAERIAQGQPATVQTGTGGELAVVAMKDIPAGEATSTVEVRLSFTAATASPLDSIVQAEIVLEELQNVLVIPAGSIQRGDNGPFVWLATDAGVATKRDIRVGLTATGLTHVIFGLMPGDQVITTGIAQLAEGMGISISK